MILALLEKNTGPGGLFWWTKQNSKKETSSPRRYAYYYLIYLIISISILIIINLLPYVHISLVIWTHYGAGAPCPHCFTTSLWWRNNPGIVINHIIVYRCKSTSFVVEIQLWCRDTRSSLCNHLIVMEKQPYYHNHSLFWPTSYRCIPDDTYIQHWIRKKNLKLHNKFKK